MFDLLEDLGFCWESNVPGWIQGLSRRVHNMVWSDVDQSLCARAAHKNWHLWQRIFGQRHCRASYAYYHRGGRSHTP